MSMARALTLHRLPGAVGAVRLAALLLGLSVAWGCGSQSPTSAAPDAATAPVGATSLPVVRVQQGRLVDTHGREVRLRGVNARIEGIFDVTFDDGRQPLQPIPAFTREDAHQMAALGFNLLRLPINWSGIEPEEGQFDEAYLARIDEVLGWCREAGVYVLIDIHQDAWSKHIGEDGAPLWAIVPAPDALLDGPLDEGELARRRVSGQVTRAFVSFWDNRDNLQERWLPMWRRVLGRWGNSEGVLGFQPFNEPVFTGPGEQKLYAFYARLYPVWQELAPQRPLFVEPDALRNFRLRSPVPPQPFLGDNVVYAPHFYPQLSGRLAEDRQGWEAIARPSFEAMRQEADAWGNAALLVGEWGADPKDAATGAYAAAFHGLADELGAGHALWLWKENSQGSWGMFDFDQGRWTLREEAARWFAPPAVLAMPGRVTTYRFDRDAGRLTVRAELHGRETAGPLLYLPERFSAGGYLVRLDGEVRQVQVDPESQRALIPWEGRAAGEVELVIETRP